MNNSHNFKSIYPIIKAEIENGKYPTGSLMMTEIEQAARFNVSRPTIAKVYSILQEEGYLHKKRGLGTIISFSHDSNKGKKTIGLLLPGAGESEIFSIINDQILRLSEEKQFTCLWNGATANNALIRSKLIESCCDNYIEQKVQGILFSPLELVDNADIINHTIYRKIHEAGIPLVMLDRDIVNLPQRSNSDMVCLDNYSAGLEIAKHMVDAGCTNILFFFKPNSAFSVQVRINGVRDFVLGLGLPFSKGHVICGQPDNKALVSSMPIIKGKTGIICANDATAAMLMSTLAEVGYHICKDLLISGFDNMKYAEHLRYPLTSYEQPCKEIANTSIDQLLNREQLIHTSPLSITLKGRIIERDSTHFI